MPIDVRWMTLFADVPAADAEADLAYWAAVTGHSTDWPSGADGEYLPLRPIDGDAVLWLQRVGREVGGWHLDLHVEDVPGAGEVATALGAREVRADDGLLVLTSPHGQPFCLVAEGDRAGGRRRAPAASWPAGQRSAVDQISMDIPAPDFEAEADFWSALTGWPRRDGPIEEYDSLAGPERLPIRILLQRLGDDDTGTIRAHADLACDDRPTEVRRHLDLGAALVRDTEYWTTLRDPAGLLYCITDRPPWPSTDS